MRARHWATALGLGLLCGAGVWGVDQVQPAPQRPVISSIPQIPVALREALHDRNFAAAVKLIDTALTAEKPTAAADYLLYLKGRALTDQQAYDAALVAFQEVETKYPQSEWLARARFGQAAVFAQQRNYQAAGKIYQTEAERLLSAGRRDELTTIYLEFADRFFHGVAAKGPQAAIAPDFAQALAYYRQALTMRPGLALRQKIELHMARSQQELQQFNEALAAYQAYLQQYSGAQIPAPRRATPEAIAEARFQLGQTQLDAGQPAEARKTWQDFLAETQPDTPATAARIAQASYRLARTYGIPQPGSVGDLELGVEALAHFVKKFPDHPLAADAEYDHALALLHHRRHEQAVQVLQSLLENPRYAKAVQLPRAWNLLGQTYAAQQRFAEALTTWQKFLELFPTHAEWSTVQRQIIDTEYQQAEVARAQQKFAAARQGWETFLNKYPLDGRVPAILLAFGQMEREQAQQIGHDPERPTATPAALTADQQAERNQRLESALLDWQRLIAKYPETEAASHAALLIGQVLEHDLGRLAEAVEAYRKVSGPRQGEAQQLLARLLAPALEIVTERKFRSTEKPRIKLTTRNIEEVQVKLYRLDLQDYFRKLHLATGVETLDIALIDPDQTLQHKVGQYAAYQQLSQDIEIPSVGPGVTAVTVTSDKHEATTMVVVSDLDILAKSSRNELFVFAQNMLTGKPATEVQLLVSDGSQVITEVKTGADGVFQGTHDSLKSIADLRIFAVQEAHCASSQVNLNGLQFAVGLSPKGYLFTDRPAYRAGELVHLKGLIRWVAQDRYTFKKGERYQLDVFDSLGRVIHTDRVALDDFGTLAAHWQLPGSAPAGTYRISIRQPGRDQAYETQFEVQEYQLEPIQFTVDLPQAVYYRGEKITGKFQLKYYYGMPVVGRSIQYRLGDDRLYTALTDDKGEVAFELPTQRYSEAQPLTLAAHYPERNLTAGKTVFLATRGFDLKVSTPRDVYVNGETFDTTVTAVDAAGQPVAGELHLEVLEVTAGPTGTGERSVQKIALETKDGPRHKTLRLEQAGKFILRATGTDRFGHTVTGERVVTVSGAADSVRLRILADKHQYQVGEAGQVQIHWREAPALALVTFEGAKVLQYQLLELKTGLNPLPFRLDDELAPNFQLGVAVMQGNQFHEDRTPFDVARELLIRLEPQALQVRPGQAVPVKVIVTDAQGQPVSAALTLGMVQKNLLDRFPDASQPLSVFFNGGRREPACRMGTSCTFRYAPGTKPIDEFLLAETTRQEEVLREQVALGLIVNSPAGGAFGAPGLQQSSDFAAPAEELAADGIEVEAAGAYRKSGAAGRAGKLNRSILALDGAMAKDKAAAKPQDFSKRFSHTNGNFYSAWSEEDRLQLNWSLDGLQNSAGVELGQVEYGSLRQLNEALALRGSQALPDVYYSQFSQSSVTWWGVNTAGELQVLNGQTPDQIKRLADDGLQLLPPGSGTETGYWNPALVTDQTGTADILIQMPPRSTAWVLRAKGINTGAIAGQAQVELITQANLFGELQLPSAFTVGDEAQIPVEVHNATLKDGEIQVTLRTRIGADTVEQKRTLAVSGAGLQELTFPVKIPQGEQVHFQLTVQSGDLVDVQERQVSIEPYGLHVVHAHGGTASQNTSFEIKPPANMKFQYPQLELVLGPSVNRSILDAVLGGQASAWQREIAPSNPVERAVSEILGGVAALKLLGASRDSQAPVARDLATRIQGAIGQLIAAQRDDGAWSWSGKRQAGDVDRNLSSRVLWAFAEARRAGFAVSQTEFDKGIKALQTALSASPETDHEIRAVLLHGLAEAGAVDFAQLNRLHRSRQSLSTSALLHLALALLRADRQPMAVEVLTLAQEKISPLPTDPYGADPAVKGCQPWMQSGVELRGLYLLALNQISPNAPLGDELSNWLLGARRGSRWQPEKANGPIIMALADWFGRVKLQPEKYILDVYVNDKLVTKLPVDPSVQPSQVLTIPSEFLVADKPQKVNLEITGRGTFTYNAVLSGFVSLDDIKSTRDDLQFSRTYEPAQQMLDGEVIPRGFGHIHAPYQAFQNSLTQLPVGERGEVTLHLWRHNVTNAADEHRDYLIFTEPLPAGVSVLTESIQGEFERYEISQNAITFYIGERAHPGTIRFSIVGSIPGKYLHRPATLRSFYRPGEFRVLKGGHLEVLPRGAKSADEYRLTPIEHYELGKRYFSKGDLVTAREHLTRLFSDYKLQDSIYGEVVRMLFQTSLAAENSAEIVQYFEILREKVPEVEVSFENILRVAQAYVELGEYERSYLVYRATLEAAFSREGQIAGFLDEQGEFLRSVQVMEQLLRSYPAEAYIATATYALAQEIYGKAAELDANPKLRAASVTRIQLIASAAHMLDYFLWTWPTDPAADQASFSLANALLDLGQHQVVVTRCAEFARRYPDSKLLDSFWYVIGYSRFALGQPDEALAMCRKVAEWKRIDPASKAETEAVNRWQAVYIMGQVHHSLGQAAQAIEQYQLVADRFADAKEAIDFFTRKALTLPEVTTIQPGQEVQIPLSFRNIPNATVKVYRIDLLKFGLLNRNLSRITAINLAGIKPYHSATLALGDGKDYRDREQTLELPLKEEGAYLVVCQGDNLYASGLALVSPLQLEVQEDAVSGRVRVTVKDTVADKYAHAVHVKVIGSGNDQFVNGESDLRGIFVADAIRGTSTIIAKTGASRYAFFRGKAHLGPQAPPAPAQDAPAPPNPEAGQEGQLLDSLRRQNFDIQSQQRGLYRSFLKNSIQGVEAKEAF